MSGLFLYMTKINDVYLHPRFEFGTTDKASVTDMPFMTDDEKLRLALWMNGILDGEEHEGLNKPSWTNGGQVIPKTQAYQDNNVWHYHCGPYTSAYANHRMTDSLLSENNQGKSSPEIYHYAKQQDVIIVLGFSRSHLPFPDATSKTNPIRNRSYSWRSAIPPTVHG